MKRKAPQVQLPEDLPTVEMVLEDRHRYEGPTDESNWVIPGHLLVGAYPADVDNQVHKAVLKSILACGINTFVCLQKEYDHTSCNPDDWRNGTKIRPYIEDAHTICETETMTPPDNLSFIHVPIADCDVTSDSIVSQVAEELCWKLLAGDVLYIHCWGGHGRTGTFVAVILGMLYKLSKVEALKRTQLYHDLRKIPLDVPSPQTFSQRMQVLRILDGVKNKPPPREIEHKVASKKEIIHKFSLPINDQRILFRNNCSVVPSELKKRKSNLSLKPHVELQENQSHINNQCK